MATKVNGLIQKVDPGNSTQYSIASTAYGYCETPAATKDKVVDMTGFTLLEGTTIHVKFQYANTASAPTLNVNGTGAKNIVQYGTTAVGTTPETNGWYAGAVVSFTYDGTSWVRDQGFNTNVDTLGLYIRYPVGTYKPAAPLYRYQILLQRDETTLVPVNTANVTSVNVTKVVTTESFNPFGIIGYYNSTTTVNTNSAINQAYLYCQYIVDLRYSFNLDTSLISQKDVYLIAEISDSIILSGSLSAKLPTDISPITQTIPHDVYDKSYIYIKLGHAYSTTQIVLTYDHPIYYVDEKGIIKPFVGATHDNAFMYITDNPSSSVAYSNTSTTNGNTYIRLFNAHSFHRTITTVTHNTAINITGTGSVDVSSDTDGVITINGTNTTYTFTNGTNGTFSVTPSGGNAQTVSIGKPATAGTADAVPWSGITGKPSTFTPTSHTHGNISNDGKISTTATIATGDRLLIVDSDTTAGNAVTGSSITFDGSTKTKALTQAGTWETFNNYSHPTSSGNKHIPAGGSSGQILRWSADGTAAWGADNDTKYTAGSGLTLSTANQFSIKSSGVTNAMLAGSIANEKLSNSKITIGGVDVSLGGSVTLAELGLSSAMHFIGKTTTALTDGASTNPIVIASKNVTAKTGDVVLSGSNKEYVFDGTNWEELGDESSYKVKQTAVNSPSASGNTLAFIDTISQNTNGVITATKKNVQSASTSQAGVLQFTAANTNAQLNTLTTGDSVPTDNDYYISQCVGGGTTTTTYHRRPVSKLYEYVKTKLAISNKAATLSWGNSTIIASVGGTDITATLPANPNTDRYVNSAAFADITSTNAASPLKMTLTRAGSDTATVTANLPKVSASSSGVAPKGAAVTTQSQSTKFLREDGTWAAPSYTVNTNTDILVKQTAKTDNVAYKILMGANSSPTSGTAYEAVYDANITINPSTHTITATTFSGALSGNASTATKFASAQIVKLTGDVTGEKSSQAGWEIATTLKNSGVTAGSYGPSANASPAHSGTFSVPYITVDAKGRVTAASTKTITLPSDNNTDTKVNVKARGTTKAYIMGDTTAPAATAAAHEAVAETAVYMDTTAGAVAATSYKVAEKVILQYNTTTNALDFVFI